MKVNNSRIYNFWVTYPFNEIIFYLCKACHHPKTKQIHADNRPSGHLLYL